MMLMHFLNAMARSRNRNRKTSIGKGLVMAGANSLKIVVKGVSKYGGKPNEAIDAIVAGSAIVGEVYNKLYQEKEVLPNQQL